MNYWPRPVRPARHRSLQRPGSRLTKLHEDRESERAYTSIVEVLASEAESHTMLAEVRESQNRWAEAIDQWRDVVRLRALEPAGLFRLAAAQIHEKQWDAAAEDVKQPARRPGQRGSINGVPDSAA